MKQFYVIHFSGLTFVKTGIQQYASHISKYKSLVKLDAADPLTPKVGSH